MPTDGPSQQHKLLRREKTWREERVYESIAFFRMTFILLYLIPYTQNIFSRPT
jgi:hypothetical protein